MPLVEVPTPHDPTHSPVFIVDHSQEELHLGPFDQVRYDFWQKSFLTEIITSHIVLTDR